jgi:hypothetical protein
MPSLFEGDEDLYGLPRPGLFGYRGFERLSNENLFLRGRDGIVDRSQF